MRASEAKTKRPVTRQLKIIDQQAQTAPLKGRFDVFFEHKMTFLASSWNAYEKRNGAAENGARTGLCRASELQS